MTWTLSPVWADCLVLSGPICALLYAVAVWLTYSICGECQWNSKTSSLQTRLAFLVMAIAIRWQMPRQEQQQQQQQQETMVMTLFMSGLFWMVSYALCCGTRQHDVVGVAQPPFYGNHHLKGKVVLVTGANNGIGKETTIQLAQMGAQVILLCRSEARAKQAMEDMLSSSSDNNIFIESTQLSFLPLDLGDFDSIRKAVHQLQHEQNIRKVDILINNAGLMMGEQTLSKDGHELMMQANHLGHFLLTRLLLDQNMLQKDARIVCLTSSTYELSKQGFDFDDMFCTTCRKYELFSQYSMTKLANLLCAKEMSRRLPSCKVFAVHPGIVRTNVTSNMDLYLRIGNAVFAWFVALVQKTPSQGAYSSVFCAAAPTHQLPASGSYIVNCQPYPTNQFADSTEDAKRLWEVSERLVGLAKEQ